MPADRPNVLFICTDQQRADSLGCYGNSVVETPNLDRLAGEGVLFEDARVTSPVCMPSRASLLTGRYPSSTGVSRNGIPLGDDERTIAELLGDAGYRTGVFGKAHFEPYSGDPDRHPEAFNTVFADVTPEESREYWAAFDGPYYGFEEVRLTLGHVMMEDGHYGRWLHDTHPDAVALDDRENALEEPTTDKPSWKSALPAEIHPTNWVADEAIDFVTRERDEPFFAWVGIPDPHGPFNPPAPYCDMYDPGEVPPPNDPDGEFWDVPNLPRHITSYLLDDEVEPSHGITSALTEAESREIVAHYYGMVRLIDDAVGRILDELEAAGLAEETVVVFTSDHGEHLGDHGLLFKMGLTHTESDTRVPWLVRWPGVAEPGRRVESVASLIDLVPTLLDAAGVEIPFGVQGRSLRPVLTGAEGSLRPYALIEYRGGAAEEYAHDGEPRSPGYREDPASEVRIKSLVTDDERLTKVWGVEEPYGELVDLGVDPSERRNLRDERPERRAALERQLLDVLVETEDPLPKREWKY